MADTTKPLDKEQRIQLFQKELDELLKKHEVELVVGIDFPNYKILPDEVKLANLIFQKHEGRLLIRVIDKKKPVTTEPGKEPNAN